MGLKRRLHGGLAGWGGFNPGYRLVKFPSYPGIADDYRRTHHKLEMVKPDIWIAQHNEYYDLGGKAQTG